MKIKVKNKLFSDIDERGNLVHVRVFYDEFGKHNNGIIYLQLANHKRLRKIGVLDFKNRTFYCNRISAVHYHRNTKGYGFNYLILTHPYIPINKIHITIDQKDHYEFDKCLIEKYGVKYTFTQTGFELQRFLPFAIMSKFKLDIL